MNNETPEQVERREKARYDHDRTRYSREVRYHWDHQCQVCFLVHVPYACCKGCGCGVELAD